MGTEKQRFLKYLLLRQVNIPLGGSEYPSSTNHSTSHSFLPSNFSTWSSCTSPLREEGISWSRYTSFFLQWVTDPLNPFHAVSHWLTHLFYLPSAIHYLRCQWKDILLSLNAFFFSAFLKWLMNLGRTAPSGRLAHLLVAVKKVCAGGVVFAWLR